MRRTHVTAALLFAATFSFGQGLPKAYLDHIRRADSLYHAGNYKGSANEYSLAFKANGWKGVMDDRYNAACSWALANVPDSAVFQLERLVSKGGYANYEQLSTDKDLRALQSHKQWKPLLEAVMKNREVAEAKLNRPLMARLDSIFREDQASRLQLMDMEKQYDWKSKEIQDHWKVMRGKDSVNLIKVKAILDTYGWLGPDVVGGQGNNTLFLVIQHSDQATQEAYLPMMRDAVKNGKAEANNLALLEDRVALGQGKHQIYGSQVARNNETQLYYILPLEDPDHVDERRASVGLPPLRDYADHWKIKWDPEQYKKDLPALEKEHRIRKK